ncbi:MAG: Mbeg1-like protein [Dokdonella sp.]
MSLSLDAGASRSALANFEPAHTPVAADAVAQNPSAATALETRSPEPAYHPQLGALQGGATPVGGISFDAQVRGTAPKAIDQTLAKLSQDVYDLPDPNAAQPKNIDGWTRMDDTQLRAAGIDPASLEDASTGFRAAVYQNADGNHVLAFAGTREGKDWYADGTQAVGLPTAQYSEAVAAATQAKAAFGDSLVVTGHSLGGGLASIASVATDSAAVTFNAAGVNDATLRRLVPDADVSAIKTEASDGLIRRYAVKGEVLTGEQESGVARGFLPDALGHKIELNDPNPLPWYEELPGVNLVTDSLHGGQLHSMDSVLAALQKDHPWAPGGSGAGVVDRIADGTGKVGNAIVGGIGAIKNGAKDIIGGITGGTGDLVGHVPVVGGLLKGVVDTVGTIDKGAVEIAGDIADGAVGIVTHLVQGAEKFVGGAIGSLVDAGKTVGGWIVDGAKAAGGAIVDGAKAAGSAIVDGAKAIGNGVADGAKAVGHAITNAMPWNW